MEENPGHKYAKLSIVGTGPGGLYDLTPRARDAIVGSEVIIGYKAYLEPISELTEGKRILRFPMGKEKDRALAAFEHMAQGHNVALISGGDPGIYGMAAPVFETMSDLTVSERAQMPVELIPGVTAASACASLAGSPIMQDYAVISLSDRFVLWEVIERRLVAVAGAEMSVVLYEPSSRHRPDSMKKTVRALKTVLPDNTPVAVVRDAFRDGQEVLLATLADLVGMSLDMKTTVIVGSSQTVSDGVRMVTARFYQSGNAEAE